MVSVGVLAGIGVCVALLIALAIWSFRYLLRKRRNDKYKLKADEVRKKRKKKQSNGKNNVSHFDSFEIPMSFRTVPAQIPTSQKSPHKKALNELSSSSLGSDRTTATDGLTRLKNKNRISRKISITSIGSANEATTYTERQQRSSEAMMKHLLKQGRYVSSQSSRPVSMVDHLDIEDKPGSGYNSDDSDASILSFGSAMSAGSLRSEGSARGGGIVKGKKYVGEEFFESALVGGGGGGKKKIASKRGNEKQEKRKYKKAGKVIFTTAYDVNNKTLTVEIVRGFDFAVKRDSTELNPFLRVYLDPGKMQVYTTKYQKGTRNPYINETIVFKEIDKATLPAYNMKIKAYNRTRIKKKELLGEVDIALSSLNIDAKETFNVNLFAVHKDDNQGTILISLCHQATFSKLEVLIQSVKITQKKHAPYDIYVSASLYSQDKIEKKDSSLKRNAKHVEFNEVLEFSVMTDTTTPLDTYSLVVSVVKRNVLGKDEIIGHVIFSRFSPQESAFYQWQSVVNEPHKRIIDWNNLCDPSNL